MPRVKISSTNGQNWASVTSVKLPQTPTSAVVAPRKTAAMETRATQKDRRIPGRDIEASLEDKTLLGRRHALSGTTVSDGASASSGRLTATLSLPGREQRAPPSERRRESPDEAPNGFVPRKG